MIYEFPKDTPLVKVCEEVGSDRWIIVGEQGDKIMIEVADLIEKAV